MTEDFSSFGKPVQSPPAVEDFSSFGKAVESPVETEAPPETTVIEKLKRLYGVAEAAVVGGVATAIPPIMAVGTTVADTVARKAAELTTGESIPGDSIGNRYMRAYEKHSKIGIALQEQMTPAGQEILDAVSRVITEGTKALGNTAFEAQRKLETNPLATLITGKAPVPMEKSLAPEVATLAESLATIAPFALGAKKAPVKKTGTFVDDYPTVNAAIEASHVGDAPVQAAVKAAPDKPITTVIHEQLDKELGINSTSPEAASMSIADKLRAVVTITGAKTGESLKPSDVTQYVNQVVSAVEQMQKQQDAIIAAGRAKGAFEKAIPTQLALPAPSPLTGPVFVDVAGKAATAEQRAMLDQIMTQLTQPDITRALPAPSPVKGTITVNPEGFAMTAKQRSEFGIPKELKGIPAKRRGKQSGVLALDAEALAKNVKSLEHLGEGVVRFAAAGLVKEPNWNNALKPNPDGTVTMYRGTRAGQDTKLGPGAWMTPDKMIAESIYSRGRGGQAAGVVTEHKVPLKELVYAHTDGYIYAPKGTDLGQVMRYRDTKGDPVTFNDLLPYQEVKSTPLGSKVQKNPEDVIEEIANKDVKEELNSLLEDIEHDEPYSMLDAWDDFSTSMEGKRGVSSAMMNNIREIQIALGDAVEVTAEQLANRISTGKKYWFKYKGKTYDAGQRGALGVGGLEKAAERSAEAVKGAVQKGWVLPNPEVAADRVRRVMDENRQAMEASRRVNAGKIIANARRYTLAHDYDLRAALKQTPAGQVALHRSVVRNGATMAAKIHMDAANKGIFDKFNHADLQTIDEITRLRRIVQIDKYRGVGSTRHEGGVTGPEADARLAQLEQNLGGDKYTQLKDASSAIFEEEKKLLDMRLEKGLISKELYDKLKDFNYTRTEYIDMVDPSIPIHSRIKNMPMSIRGSGIPELGHGKTIAVNMDNRSLMMEDMARAYNSVFKNDALMAMRELAVREADNGIVRLPPKDSVTVQKNGDMKMKHTPEGWTAIGVRNEGRQEFILMKDEFAEQFVARPEASLAEYMATVFRIASGTSAIKYTSTGANPAFVLAGIPMDIWHTWVASSGSYSPHLPVGLAQMGKDMAAAAKDAWSRKGAWVDAMNEGIGSSYMTHEARGLTDPTKTIQGVMAPKMRKIREALSYVNESADMWLRLAYRKRLIDQGVPSWEATAMARDRLDYYQGGPVAKAFDAIIPYTNVAIQATAKGAERLVKPLFTDVAPQYALSGVKNKYTPRQEALIKGSWIVGTAAAVKLASMVTSPETDKNISVMDKVRNYNITFGDNLYVLDANGNKRYMYVPVRLDQTIMPLNAAVVGGLELAEYGKAPRGITTSAIGQISPVSSKIPIPSIEAIASYVHNYDSFTDSPVYKGPKVLPEAEVRTFGQGKPTSPFAVAAGQTLGMSPIRLENSIGKVINYNNFYIKSMGFMAKELFEGADPREQAMSSMEMLANAPGLSNVVKLTTPYNSLMEELMDAEKEANTPIALATSGLNDLMFQYQKGQNGVTTKTIQTYINNQPAEYRQKLADHAKYTVNVDKVMSRYEASDKIPPRAWWIAAAKVPAEARAQVFYNEWVSAEPEDRKRMLGIARGLQNSGVGFLSDDFKRAFAAERKLLGDDPR